MGFRKRCTCALEMKATIVVVLAVVVVEGAVSPGAIGGGGVAALRRLRGGIQFNSIQGGASAVAAASNGKLSPFNVSCICRK